MSLFTKQQVIRGLSWKSTGVVSHKSINMLVQLALVYYLLPEHFGLIGMAGAFVALITSYTDMGIGVALIQRKDKNLKDEHWHTAYWLNLCVSWAGFCIVVFGLAPLAAWYYKQDILAPLCMAISLTLLWSPLAFIHKVRLQKQLRFKQIFTVNLIGTICGGTSGIVMAFNSFGVWSIAGMGIVSSLVRLCIVRSMEPWNPRVVVSRQAAKDLFGFGGYDVLNRIVGFCNNQVNALLLGGLFAPAIVGYFVFANSLTNNVLKPINEIFKKVFFPFFSGIQEDAGRIKRYYLEQIRYSALVIFPVACGLMLVADKAFHLFFGTKWDGAVQPLNFLCVFILITVIGGTPGTVFRSMGAVKLNLKLSLLKYLVIRVPCVLLGGFYFGFKGYLWALLLTQVIILGIDISYLYKFIQLSLWDIVKALRNVIFSSAVLVVCVLLLGQFCNTTRIFGLVMVVLGGAASFGLIYLLLENGSRILMQRTKSYKTS